MTRHRTKHPAAIWATRREALTPIFLKKSGIKLDLSRLISMKKNKSLIPVEKIEALIVSIRGQRVILDSELAKIYGIPTFRFNEAVKRNRGRFPEDFMFQLSRQEVMILTSQNAISSSGHRR